MKAFTPYLVIFLILSLTACVQTASPSDQFATDVKQDAPAVSPEAIKPANPTTKDAQAMSDAPLSNGILLSRYDTIRNKSELFAIDSQSGLPIASAPPIPMGASSFNVRSPDGKTLASVFYPNANSTNGQLNFIDLAKWQVNSLDVDVSGWVGEMTYSPDRRYLVIVTWQRGSGIYLVDVNTSTLVSQKFIKDKFAKAQFTQDGSALMLYMNRWDTINDTEISPTATLMSIPDLEVKWEQALDGVKHGFFVLDKTKNPHEPGAGLNYDPGIAFSPVDDRLYIVHADEARLTSVDFNQQDVTSVEIAPKLSWLERLLWLDASPAKAKILNGTVKSAVISSDGKTIYTTGITHEVTQSSKGEWEYKSIPVGFQIIEARSGTELAKYDVAASSLKLSPDGRILLYNLDEPDQTRTLVFDPGSDKMGNIFEGVELVPAYRINGELAYVSVRYLPNGSQILGLYDAQMNEIFTYKPGTGLFDNWIVGQ